MRILETFFTFWYHYNRCDIRCAKPLRKQDAREQLRKMAKTLNLPDALGEATASPSAAVVSILPLLYLLDTGVFMLLQLSKSTEWK